MGCSRSRSCSRSCFSQRTSSPSGRCRASRASPARSARRRAGSGERGTARLVLLGEPHEERMQLSAFLLAERLQELVLVPARERAQAPEGLRALWRHPDEVAAAVVGIPLALHEPLLLQ